MRRPSCLFRSALAMFAMLFGSGCGGCHSEECPEGLRLEEETGICVAIPPDEDMRGSMSMDMSLRDQGAPEMDAEPTQEMGPEPDEMGPPLEDMGPDAGLEAMDMGEPPGSVEAFRISYLAESGFGANSGERFLYTLDTRDGGPGQKVSVDASHCRLGCWLSEDAQTFVYLREVAGDGGSAQEVYAAPVDARGKIQGDGEVLATGVRRVRFDGRRVSFVRGAGASPQVSFVELGAADEVPVGALDGGTA
mgnify:CR=1 FL=1